MPGERQVDTREIFRGRGMDLRVDTVITPDGRTTTREVLERAQAVVLIALDEQERILLVKQYRYAVKQFLLELPAGMIEPGETPEDCARRELQEETGFYPLKLEKICNWWVAPGFCSEFMHLFLASDLTPSRLIAEDTDEIEVLPTDIPEAVSLIDSGRIQDGKTIAGILLYLFKTGKYPNT
ncbi:MAG: NUDIX hydrolase [Dehalococcoidia bacterium]|nr:NUDIX hydrolase [Dehalococcoidia bacterium]